MCKIPKRFNFFLQGLRTILKAFQCILHLSLYAFYFNAGRGKVVPVLVVKAYGEVQVNVHSFIILALDGD
jgi:hypothetical protein